MLPLERLIARAETLLDRLEQYLPAAQSNTIEWNQYIAWRWRKQLQRCYLQAVTHTHQLKLDDLRGLERQKQELLRNTRQFLAGLPANNALLWGARGTGKSSLIKALLHELAPQGLRLIEVDKDDLVDLPDIIQLIYGRPERFIIYCDDLSFEANEPSYKALKAILDGSISATPDNVLVYATSNRRHLLPEYMSENREAQIVEGELHLGDAIEEKVSLSERFGLWLSFHPFSQDIYLKVVDHWLKRLGHTHGLDDESRTAALRWALSRGSRSGRVAWQFARDWVGRYGIA